VRNLFAQSFLMVLLFGFLHALLGGLSTGVALVFAPVMIASLLEGRILAVETPEESGNRRLRMVPLTAAEVYPSFFSTGRLLSRWATGIFRLMPACSVLIVCGVFTLISLIVIRWCHV
jgi:hypothetical protein